jgi:hypothetical protein
VTVAVAERGLRGGRVERLRPDRFATTTAIFGVGGVARGPGVIPDEVLIDVEFAEGHAALGAGPGRGGVATHGAGDTLDEPFGESIALFTRCTGRFIVLLVGATNDADLLCALCWHAGRRGAHLFFLFGFSTTEDGFVWE